MDISIIKTGDCILSSSNSWLGKSIKWFTKSKWNHCMIAYWCYDQLFVIEENTYANAIGLLVTPFEEYVKSNKDLAILRPKFDIDGSKYGQFMLPMLGKTKYNFWDLIIAQPIYQFTNKKIWIGSKETNIKKMICSMFVGYVYNHFNPLLYKEWNKLFPGEFYTDKNLSLIIER